MNSSSIVHTPGRTPVICAEVYSAGELTQDSSLSAHMEIYHASKTGGFSLPCSGYDILQVVMFPTIEAQNDALPRQRATLSILVNGVVMDIVEQEWSGSCASPNLELGTFYISLHSMGYGYNCFSDFQKDLCIDDDHLIAVMVDIQLNLHLSSV